ncbi:relaxase/mobilization nuclease domain-containing protein [Lactococcus cremoris subsp. cremoris HP]|nr:relaxase/mobilization nuclease domain-containing protein [Lactococcus cremoris subsp. cremoris HP]
MTVIYMPKQSNGTVHNLTLFTMIYRKQVPMQVKCCLKSV